MGVGGAGRGAAAASSPSSCDSRAAMPPSSESEAIFLPGKLLSLQEREGDSRTPAGARRARAGRRPFFFSPRDLPWWQGRETREYSPLPAGLRRHEGGVGQRWGRRVGNLMTFPILILRESQASLFFAKS